MPDVGVSLSQTLFPTHTLVTMDSPEIKHLGAYYTPESVIQTLHGHCIQDPSGDTVLDPSCGDGRFLVGLDRATGVDLSSQALSLASQKCPRAQLVSSELFAWAQTDQRRFQAVVGNPPFIRYQSTDCCVRSKALEHCARFDVRFNKLTSTWAPFVVASATKLEYGGRLGMVVPAEISYARYARPLLSFLVGSFSHVSVYATKDKLFPRLSEDCWLLVCRGYGGSCDHIDILTSDTWNGPQTSWKNRQVDLGQLKNQGFRLRPFLASEKALALYADVAAEKGTRRLGELAKLGIGYVTGDNDYFHMSASQAERLSIPSRVLLPTVRSNKDLEGIETIDPSLVRKWKKADRTCFLLYTGSHVLTPAIDAYLGTKRAALAKSRYKCRQRNPWHVVPDIKFPDAFLTIMATSAPKLVPNLASCTCSNSVNAVFFNNKRNLSSVYRFWGSPLHQFSCEIEGHRLGGGMFKLEPNEARSVIAKSTVMLNSKQQREIEESLIDLRSWSMRKAQNDA